ncbi:O-methyltransferase [Parapedobacter sp. DT-150]|uniref:O-methyltransferase n=1 Tax=Parapedobacter sp. DT-150 TaxID=3396162 RepID=UPI003F1DAA5F
MNDTINQPLPQAYHAIAEETRQFGFTMPSDVQTCALLRTLAASKPAGRFLELGTGSGLATAWVLDGMDGDATLVSFDHDDALLAIARKYLGHDKRLSLVLSDGAEWVHTNAGQSFDFIFADTWHGKYLLLDEVLAMLRPGGLYIVDDMLPQPNWPEGHQEKAFEFVRRLESRGDLWIAKQHWATGMIIGVKRCI